VITIKASSQKNEYFKSVSETIKANTISASWLSFDPSKMTAQVTGQPTREELTEEIDEQLIIEYYSR
jgi:ribosomal protein S4